MRVIIAGGRDYAPRRPDIIEVIKLLDGIGAREIVSGGAHGADTFGEMIAWGMDLPVKRFEADWDKHGKGAGMIRNEEMSKYAEALIALPGGVGTADMVNRAKKRGLRVFDLRSLG